MRFLSVSSTGGTLSLIAGSSNHAAEIHGFAINLLETSPSRVRFRSVQLGQATVVSMMAGEVDKAASQEQDSQTEPNNMDEDVYIVIGSDDGFTEVTLLRIAALISELCIFLSIGPRSQGNVYVLRMVLCYLEMRMAAFDLGFLAQSIESVFCPAITATGYSTNPKGLYDELVRANLFDDRADEEQMPGYSAVLFGNKMLLETSGSIAEEACKINNVEKFALNDADRYLLFVVTSAFFAVPHPHATSARVAEKENRIRLLEQRLAKFDIHRQTVTRKASRDVITQYCRMLRSTCNGTKPCEEKEALFLEAAFEELLSYASLFVPNAQNGEDCSAFLNRYHHELVDFAYLESQVFTLHNCAFRNSDYFGKVQLHWAQSPEPAVEEGHISDLCPYGYGVCIVYFPGKSEKEKNRLEAEYPLLVPEEPIRSLGREVLGSVEMSFNRFQWLLSPPVESYETPGLVHFIAIDRRDNSSVCGSFERMMHQKPAEVQRAVHELKRTMAQCMSKAHELLSLGYSEGLWGHLGMQFFYAIGTAPTSAVGSSESQSSVGSRLPSVGGGGPTGGREGDQGGLFGASDAKKLPPSIVEHVVLRPMLIPDFVEEGSKQAGRVVEMYAMFLGCMSPLEVCQSVEWLRNSRLFS